MFADNTSPLRPSVTVVGTGEAVAGIVNLVGMFITPTGTVGSIVFTDGTGGTTMLTVPTTASANEIAYVNLPAHIQFKNGIWVATFTNVTSVELLIG